MFSDVVGESNSNLKAEKRIGNYLRVFILSGCPPKSGPASLGSSVNLPFIFCG